MTMTSEQKATLLRQNAHKGGKARAQVARLKSVGHAFVVELPFPDSELMQNRNNGRHWSYAHEAKTTQKLTAYLMARQAITGALFEAQAGAVYRIDMEFNPPDKRRRDVSNLHAAMKAALDGIAEAMGVDDSRFVVHEQRMGAMHYQGRVVVKVSEIR
jgi:crossover junction endodeoxyribonuclease RusA